jgi:hypothetical protein
LAKLSPIEQIKELPRRIKDRSSNRRLQEEQKNVSRILQQAEQEPLNLLKRFTELKERSQPESISEKAFRNAEQLEAYQRSLDELSNIQSQLSGLKKGDLISRKRLKLDTSIISPPLSAEEERKKLMEGISSEKLELKKRLLQEQIISELQPPEISHEPLKSAPAPIFPITSPRLEPPIPTHPRLLPHSGIMPPKKSQLGKDWNEYFENQFALMRETVLSSKIYLTEQQIEYQRKLLNIRKEQVEQKIRSNLNNKEWINQKNIELKKLKQQLHKANKAKAG